MPGVLFPLHPQWGNQLWRFGAGAVLALTVVETSMADVNTILSRFGTARPVRVATDWRDHKSSRHRDIPRRADGDLQALDSIYDVIPAHREG